MKIKDLDRSPKHITSIGGQALIEGIMMKGPKDISIAVRKPEGNIELKTEKLNSLGMRYPILKLPLIRGVVGLFEAMETGIEALTYSAEAYFDEEDLEEGFFDRHFSKDKAEKLELFFTILMSLTISIVLFMLIPNLITSLFVKNIDSHLLLNLVEGLIRITIFLIYLLLMSRSKETKRLFEYHGAEHKTIHCYENGDPLTVENVKKYPILHPRCGTSFMFMVMIVSIVVLSFFGWPNPVKRLLIRLLMLPVIAGISYEINRAIGKSNSKLSYYLSYPGLMMQKFATVKEPDGDQIEVAIEALKLVIPDNKEDDRW